MNVKNVLIAIGIIAAALLLLPVGRWHRRMMRGLTVKLRHGPLSLASLTTRSSARGNNTSK